jgi:hypothetical protein
MILQKRKKEKKRKNKQKKNKKKRKKKGYFVGNFHLKLWEHR